MKNNKGFTLLELLLGLTMTAIIFVVATNFIVSFLGVSTKSRISQEVEQVKRDITADISSNLTWGKSIAFVNGILEVDESIYRIQGGRLYKNDSPLTPANVEVSNMVLKRFVENMEVDAPGSGRGLVGTYYSGRNFESLVTSQTDFEVNFDWSVGSPAEQVPSDNFSVRWSGAIEIPTSGQYTFYALTDDGVRLWVNNNLIINRWVEQGPNESRGQITLSSGQLVEIRMEYFDKFGGAVSRLSWSGPGISKSVIPASFLYPTTPVTSLSFDVDLKHVAADASDKVSLFVSPRGGTIGSVLPPPTPTPTQRPTVAPTATPATTQTPFVSPTPTVNPTPTAPATVRPTSTPRPPTPTATPTPTQKPLR